VRFHKTRFSPVPKAVAIISAVAILLLSLVAGCSSNPTDDIPSEVTERLGPAGSIPTGLDRFYTQSLTWGSCGSYAVSSDARSAFTAKDLRCARLTVPLDYANPAGDTITLGLLRTKASDPNQRLGSLVINPGGPGASGMITAAGLAASVKRNDLGKRFDLVGFDPRGIGASQPQIKCLTGPERDTERVEDLSDDGSPEGVAKQEADARSVAQKCAARTEHGDAMLANIGTRDVVKDMDVLRAALGDQKLTYLGYSYGTRIGYTYAEAFPRNVRAMILDGALDPVENGADSLVAQGKGFGQAFGKFAEWCASQQGCALGNDPAAATKVFQNLTRPLIDQPLALQDGRKLSYGDATLGTIQALYSQQLWELLDTGLNGLKAGRGEALMALADQYNERDPEGNYDSSQDAFLAIRCVDDPPITDKQQILSSVEQYDQAAPFLDDGRPVGAALDSCAFWPVPNTSQPHEPKIDGLPPVLVISTTNDPATPYQAGVNLAADLKGSLLTFEGTQHTVFLQGVECVDNAGVAYLTQGTLPANGSRCAPNP
jgi:pimeloyl-ACP methyl ester carboxylesterase